jgi:hypothetical protein
MSRYAKKTQVSSIQSRAEIERTLTRYGATGFAYAWQDNRAIVGFKMHGKQIRFQMILPDKNDPEFVYT